MRSPERLQRNIPFLRIAIAVFFACILLWVLVGSLVFFNFDNWDDRGKAGDMFGAVNALFSSLALAGVIVAFLLQWKQLGLQQEEQAKAWKAQHETERLLADQVAALSLSSKLLSLSTLINLHEQRLRAARESLAKDPSREADYGRRIEEYTRQLQELTERALSK